MKIAKNQRKSVFISLILALGIMGVVFGFWYTRPRQSEPVVAVPSVTMPSANESLLLTLYVFDSDNYDSPKEKKNFTFPKEEYEKNPTKILNTLFSTSDIKLNNVTILKTERRLVADLTKDTVTFFEKGSSMGITLTNELIMTLLHLPDIEEVEITVEGKRGQVGNHFNFKEVFTVNSYEKYQPVETPINSTRPESILGKDEYNINLSTKVAVINKKETLYYGKEKNIFIMSGEKCFELTKPFSGYPEISPDKKKITYADPVDFEVIGNLYVYDISSRKNIKITNYNYGQEDTVKLAKWLDNDRIFLIIGYAYGTVTQGGRLYLYDLNSNKLTLLITPEKRTEIKNFNILEDKIIFDIVRWTDDKMAKFAVVENEMTKVELSNLIKTRTE